jgi:hypothetical protein
MLVFKLAVQQQKEWTRYLGPEILIIDHFPGPNMDGIVA